MPAPHQKTVRLIRFTIPASPGFDGISFIIHPSGSGG